MQVTSIHEGCAYIRGRFEHVPLQGPFHLCSESQGVALLLSVASPTANRGLFRFARRKGTQPIPHKNTNRDCLQSQNIQAGKYCKSRSNVLKKLLSTRLRKLVTPTPAYNDSDFNNKCEKMFRCHHRQTSCPRNQSRYRTTIIKVTDRRNQQNSIHPHLPATKPCSQKCN